MLVVVDFRLFDGLVFVIEAEKRGNPKAEEHAQQEKNHDRSDASHQPVGNHGEPLLYILAPRSGNKAQTQIKRPAGAGLL
jgi:hypothetical protein